MWWGVVLLILVLVQPAPAWATVKFFAGAETGDLSEVTNNSNPASNTTADTSVVKSGAYSFKVISAVIGPGSSFKTPVVSGTPTTIYARFYFRSTMLHGSVSAVADFNNAADTVAAARLRLGFGASQNLLIYANNAGTTITTGTTVLSADTWYLLEAKIVVSATVGGMELKINGVQEFSTLNQNNSAAGNVSLFYFGGYLDTGSGTHIQYYDNIAISDSAYLGAGTVISRQGTAGTPTYDAWTKNSCTGGTIDGCWSNTPFTTGSNATSATASAAQTMLVSSMLTTQTGHGSEVMTSSDVVNACKTAVVAKMATASSFSIRRRVGGTDTDTAKTLTTSDAYYDDGIWTTSPALLASAEIGGVHGTGTNTMTVEDAWLICDFAPSVGGVPRKVMQY